MKRSKKNYYFGHIRSANVQKPLGIILIAVSTRFVEREIIETSIQIGSSAAIILIIAIVLTVLMARLITGPLKIITMDVGMVGEGNLNHKINVHSSDEIGYLATEFNKMVGNLSEAQKKLVTAAATQKEIQVAGQIQQDLLPQGVISFKNIEAFGMSSAAKTVGGDYFDFFEVSPNIYGSIISDVSGKGIPAGLIMTMIKTIFRTAKLDDKKNSLSDLVNRANTYLAANSDPTKFATLNITLFNTKTKGIICTDAGHNDFFIYSNSKKEIISMDLPNMPIGITPDVKYAEQRLKLKKNDFICFFTDGITEARNTSKQDYGEEKIKKLLIDYKDKTVQEITEGLMKDVRNFTGEAPQHDDMTIITVKFTG